MHSTGAAGRLSCAEATFAMMSLERFLVGYLALAKWSFKAMKCHYVLVPKLHYLKHLWLDLRRWLSDQTAVYILNPAMLATPCGEDFIGKISRPMRELHSSTASARRLELYRVELKKEWRMAS